ncbi:MAG: chemotaxis protein CheW [Lachnospiraceae bacterium]|nr:chemotaxis protein CheW [Lachnospiraceae bacterium]
MKQVLCKVGNSLFGIDIEKVQGIEKKMDVTPVPNTPKLIRGISNLRGSVVPIINLHEKLGMDNNENDSEKTYIITRIGELLVGFMVDSVAEIVELNDGSLIDVPQIVKDEGTSYIQFVLNVNKQLVLVLDVDEILDESERTNLNKLVDDVTN